jgi:hypothetical protein
MKKLLFALLLACNETRPPPPPRPVPAPPPRAEPDAVEPDEERVPVLSLRGHELAMPQTALDARVYDDGTAWVRGWDGKEMSWTGRVDRAALATLLASMRALCKYSPGEDMSLKSALALAGAGCTIRREPTAFTGDERAALDRTRKMLLSACAPCARVWRLGKD